MYFITENDVFAVHAEEIYPSGGRPTKVWRIRFVDADGNIKMENSVEYTEYVYPKYSPQEQILYAVRSMAFKQPNHPRERIDYGWGSGNRSELALFDDLSDDQLDHEILKRVFRFYKKYPHFALDDDSLAFSINADPRKIHLRADALAKQGYLAPAVNGLHKYSTEIFQRIEARLKESKSFFVSGGYFKEVPLTQIHDEPYVFVLMPFKDTEFPQRLWNEIIQPTLKKTTGINCLRADVKQNANLITDQIYSQIKRAAVLVAEVTSLNPNVMVEVGVALTLAKQVYMFHNEMKRDREDIPFYVRQVPVHGYKDEEEFELKLALVEAPR